MLKNTTQKMLSECRSLMPKGHEDSSQSLLQNIIDFWNKMRGNKKSDGKAQGGGVKLT